MKRFMLLGVALLLALVMAAGCGANSGGDTQTQGQNTGSEASSGNSGNTAEAAETPVATTEPTASSLETSGDTGDTSGEKTLSVSVCWDFYYIEEAAEKFKLTHPGVTINITKFDNDYTKYISQISTALMAGSADDLLDGSGLAFTDPATVKLLADFYPVMRDDPSFNESDYYMNVFKALEYNGGLYTYPTCFGYELNVVNTLVSDKLTENYAKYTSVNPFDLLDLRSSVPEGSGYYYSDSFDVMVAVMRVMDAFVDYDKKTCDFNNPRFINFLTQAKAATEPGKMLGYTYGSNVYAPEAEAEQSQKYLYLGISSSVYQYLFEYENGPVFTNPIPVTNERGEMSISPLKNFCISAKSLNQALAWEFIKSMSALESNDYESGYVFIPDIPVYKPLFQYKMENELPGWVDYFKTECGWRLSGQEDTQIAEAIAKMDAFASLPVSYTQSAYYGIISDTLEQFHNGNLSAEQCAQEIQNKISLALME